MICKVASIWNKPIYLYTFTSLSICTSMSVNRQNAEERVSFEAGHTHDLNTLLKNYPGLKIHCLNMDTNHPNSLLDPFAAGDSFFAAAIVDTVCVIEDFVVVTEDTVVPLVEEDHNLDQNLPH